ncbi:hypothetical protein C8Q76DRAFT_750006 [Earliella scabrosa]|nr:hypothetical protein C8Q76DRAFT_750006 [Earliella scabrosa]
MSISRSTVVPHTVTHNLQPRATVTPASILPPHALGPMPPHSLSPRPSSTSSPTRTRAARPSCSFALSILFTVSSVPPCVSAPLNISADGSRTEPRPQTTASRIQHCPCRCRDRLCSSPPLADLLRPPCLRCFRPSAYLPSLGPPCPPSRSFCLLVWPPLLVTALALCRSRSSPLSFDTAFSLLSSSLLALSSCVLSLHVLSSPPVLCCFCASSSCST